MIERGTVVARPPFSFCPRLTAYLMLFDGVTGPFLALLPVEALRDLEGAIEESEVWRGEGSGEGTIRQLRSQHFFFHPFFPRFPSSTATEVQEVFITFARFGRLWFYILKPVR